MGAEIRRAAASDLTALLALDEFTRTDERRHARLTAYVAADACFVAELSGEITGYAVLTRDFFDQGFIPLLYVDATHRRVGIGAALMIAVEARTPTDKLFTSTNRSNAAMRALLAKLGYVEVGMVDGLDVGDPEVFYLKRASPPPTS